MGDRDHVAPAPRIKAVTGHATAHQSLDRPGAPEPDARAVTP